LCARSRLGIRPKTGIGPDGNIICPTRFVVGPLAYLLKNRFDTDEVVYRGEARAGEQTSIIDKELFDAVQGKLAEKIGLPIELGKISSRKKCSCAITPTCLPLALLTGIIASMAS
jgi:hypothetical protein